MQQLQLDMETDSFPAALSIVRLEARDSPRHAFYHISIHEIQGVGYFIRKSSGASGARPNCEIWFRPTLKSALEKQAQLVQSKLKNNKKRTYSLTEGNDSPEQDLSSG